MNDKKYPGLGEDLKQGMTPTAKIILDAKVFGLLPEDEDCEGWLVTGVLALYDKVSKAWEPYGLLPSRLPDDLKEKHARIFGEAVKVARQHGWDPDDALQGEE